MKKEKIAISVDVSLLKEIDSRIDGSVMRSRSQAIEYFLKIGLQDEGVTTAVLLLKGSHQSLALKKIKGDSLINSQINFFANCGINNLFIITQRTKNMNFLLREISKSKIRSEIIENAARGNANALEPIRKKVDGSFVVMSGDTYNNFDLLKMVRKHAQSERIATMGLMTREKASSYGTAILDGDFIVDFKEKPKHYSTNIVNAGIYIFKPEVFELFDGAVSLEKEVFPRLARLKQLVGFFTYGEYIHFGS